MHLLMIWEPEKYAEAFKKAVADILTITRRSLCTFTAILQQIKSLGMQAGVALNTYTSESLKDMHAMTWYWSWWAVLEVN